MLTNLLLQKIEPFLKDQIMRHYQYDFDFEPNSSGDRILQAARIAVFEMTLTYHGGIGDIFDDPEQKALFFGLVDSELKERGRELEFFPSLDASVGEYGDATLGNLLESGTVYDSEPENNVKTMAHFDMSDLRKTLSPKEFQIAKVLGMRMLQNVAHSEEKDEALSYIQAGLEKLEYIIEQGHGRHYSSLVGLYAKSLSNLYEQVKTGKIKNWRALSRGNVPFFDWEINLREVVRHATEGYILPHYNCTLENLPIQDKLIETLETFKIFVQKRVNSVGVREYFLKGFPEMRNSEHWHPARWPRNHHEKFSKETDKEYFRFNRDYIFRHRLGCRTREDVIVALDEENRLRELIREERIPTADYRKDGFSVKTVLYEIVRDLEGPMYNIKPWELKLSLPKGTFWNNEGSPNEQSIAEYFEWVDRTYGLPQNIFGSNIQIPHWSNVKNLGLSYGELKELYPKKEVLQINN